jgi:hypothetical protein
MGRSDGQRLGAMARVPLPGSGGGQGSCKEHAFI